jgi:hypothetical protein
MSRNNAWPFFSDGHRVRPGVYDTADVLNRLRRDLEAIATRAAETSGRLRRGEALTGITGLVEIENQCRDALALLDTAQRAGPPRS